MADGGKTRIAILGGGAGAMTAAYEITETPGWQDKYEITVYQMGWRLGGKGASGRNGDAYDRIEEHGLHLWFGYYENAFNLMRRAYAALGRKPHEPLATWRDAFKKHSLFVIGEFNDGQWSRWPITAPETSGEPGDGEVPTLQQLVEWVIDFLQRHFDTHAPAELRRAIDAIENPCWVGALARAENAVAAWVPAFRPLAAVRWLLGDQPARTTAGAPIADLVAGADAFLAGVRRGLAGWLGELWEHELKAHPDLRRLMSVLELGSVTLKGIIADDVLHRGFDALDDEDYREWLHRHGAGPLALNADALRVAYETIFAYRSGCLSQPDLAAGTAIRGLLRLCFGYKGAIAWKMQAGMGDTVFAPLYLVLKQRGVRFEFFQQVLFLHLNDAKDQIDKIDIGVQATVKNGADYVPLYDVKGLPCWPSQPFFKQLNDGDKLKESQIDFEDNWDLQRIGTMARATLEYGRDFDVVVLGISLGGLSPLCAELVMANDKWGAMQQHVRTVGTQAFQLWLTRDLAELGWTTGAGTPVEPPVVGGFAQPQNTYADMSHLIPRESWPTNNMPRSIAYFCGQAAANPIIGYGLNDKESVYFGSQQWIRSNATMLWPRSTGTGFPRGFTEAFDPDFLVGHKLAPPDFSNPKLPPITGPIPMDLLSMQYWRANVQHAELYVLSVAGTTKHRLPSDRSGFKNLFLAGDWTLNGLNYGCVESAVMSGMQAARAITGSRRVVFGENFPAP